MPTTNTGEHFNPIHSSQKDLTTPCLFASHNVLVNVKLRTVLQKLQKWGSSIWLEKGFGTNVSCVMTC